MPGFRRSTVKASVRRRLWALIGAFLVILAADSWLSLEALQDLASISGYRRGLETWSRTRSAAAAHLHQLIQTGEPSNWQGFTARMAVLAGFEEVRLALSESPGRKGLGASLARLGMSSKDARRVMEASEELRSLPRWSDLLGLWRTAGRHVDALDRVGAEVEAEVRSGALGPSDAARLHRRVGELDRELEYLELSLSNTLQESRELLERRFLTEQLGALGLLVALVLGLGLWTSLRLDREMDRRFQAEEDRLRLEERLREVERLEAVGRLAGGVAHDFNNLLTAILGNCELAQGMIDPASQAQHQLLEVQRAARRAADLTRQLLAFSRRQAIEPRLLDLNRAVTESVSMLRRLLVEDVLLEVRLNAAPATVLLDPSQVDQLLINLVVNARDAMPRGGTIRIETARERREGLRPGEPVDLLPGEYVLLAVSDTGQGMDRATKLHAFEPFFTTKEKGKGTGLGLSTVYGIVKQNSGFISLDSEPGAGATFRMFFPGVQGVVAEEEKAVLGSRAARATATVLLVEDEPAVRALIRHLLAGRGYTVLEAADAPSALAVLAEHHAEIDLLITDLVLPGMSGDALAARIHEARPDVATLFISGYSEAVLGERGVLPAGFQLLKKPFEAHELLARVEELLGGAETRRDPAPS